MASHNHLTPLITFTICFILATYTVSSRDIFVPIDETNNGTTMISDCWTALHDVRSCSNEIVSYFNNGTIDIGVSCCQAIKTITHDCWPNLLAVVGITVEESNVLRGYCEVDDSSSTDHVIDPVLQDVLETTSVDISNGTKV